MTVDMPALPLSTKFTIAVDVEIDYRWFLATVIFPCLRLVCLLALLELP